LVAAFAFSASGWRDPLLHQQLTISFTLGQRMAISQKALVSHSRALFGKNRVKGLAALNASV
jgi:hypothetical protein